MATDIPPLDKIDIRLLRVFKVVTECGGFSAAEETLNLSRSTISIHISDLETRFGLRLCTRGPSGFALTKHGEVVYEATLSLFNAINGFRSSVSGAKGHLMGELTVWMMDNMATDGDNPTIDALRRFRQRPNDVEIIVNVQTPFEVERAVYDGRCDLGITGSKTLMPNLIYDELHSEEMSLYCGRGHSLFERSPDDLDEGMLAEVDFVRRGFVAPGHELLEAPWQSTAMSMHMEATHHLIATGLYVGYLPTHYGRFWEGQGELRQILPTRFKVIRPIYAVHRKATQETAVLSAILADLKSAFAASSAPKAKA
jgi:DNA-binding transcriptional LysR family regulator